MSCKEQTKSINNINAKLLTIFFYSRKRGNFIDNMF